MTVFPDCLQHHGQVGAVVAEYRRPGDDLRAPDRGIGVGAELVVKPDFGHFPGLILGSGL